MTLEQMIALGWSARTIAQELGVTRNAVIGRIWRAKQKLRGDRPPLLSREVRSELARQREARKREARPPASPPHVPRKPGRIMWRCGWSYL